jgi:hypothetical protein
MDSALHTNLAKIVGGVPQNSNTDSPLENRSLSIQAIGSPPHLTPLLDGIEKPALKTRPYKGGHILVCAFTNKLFGGIFTEKEAQALVIWAGLLTQPVKPSEFGNAAAQIVRGVAL